MTKKQTNDELQKAISSLPPEMQTLLRLATAPNSTREVQLEAARSIVEGSPISSLRKFFFHFIGAQSHV